MKEHFPRYKKGNRGEKTQAEIIFDSMPKTSKSLIEKYLIKRRSTAGEGKVNDIKRYLIQFYDFLEKPLDKLKKADIDNLAIVLNKEREKSADLVKVIKSFLKWHYKDLEMIENLHVKNGADFDESKINENALIEPEEVEKMLKFAESYKEKALLFVEFESGARPQEILNLKWADIKFEDGRADINVFSGKTRRSRTFPLNKSAKFLYDWKQNYTYGETKPDDFVFPSRFGRDKAMTSDGANKILRKMAEKAGIKKKIWNYIFRHTRATRLYEELPTPIVEKLMGHKDQYGRYAHISTRKAREEMLNKIYHIGELSPETKNEMQKEIDALKKQNEAMKSGLKEVTSMMENYFKLKKIHIPIISK